MQRYLSHNKNKITCLQNSGLDRKAVKSHLHAPPHAILIIHVWYIARLKHIMGCFPTCARFTYFLQSLHYVFI